MTSNPSEMVFGRASKIKTKESMSRRNAYEGNDDSYFGVYFEYFVYLVDFAFAAGGLVVVFDPAFVELVLDLPDTFCSGKFK